jgi:hypothetical protein
MVKIRARSSPRSPPPRSSSSTSSADKKGWGLTSSIQKQLLVDIEEAGGLASCNLEVVCNAKEDIYGQPNSKHRRKVQNVLKYWRGLSAQAFAAKRQSFLLLESSQTTPTTQPTTPTKSSPTPTNKPSKPTRRSTLSSSKPSSRPTIFGIMEDLDIPFGSKYFAVTISASYSHSPDPLNAFAFP